MSVQRGTAPEDGVALSRIEALVIQWKLFQDWTPSSDVWAINYGAGILTMVSGISGFFINRFYRRALKLGRHGHFSSYLPITVLPGVFTVVLHKEFVTSPIIMQEIGCSVCTQLRALALQASLGLLYPLLLAPVSNYMLASRLGTVRMPMMYYEMRKFRGFHMKTSAPLYRNLWIFIAVNIFAASAVTYFEMMNTEDIMEKINEIEKDMIAKGITFNNAISNKET